MKYGLIAYLILINIAAFALYAMDKKRAQRKMWRVPEGRLLLIAALGGSLGALCAMHALHHKTKHAKFYILVPTFFFVHAGVFAYLFWRFS